MIKRKILIILFLFLLLAAAISLTAQKYLARQSAKQQIQVFNKLPIVTLDSTSFDHTSLARDEYVIVVYYSGECQPCVNQLLKLIESTHRLDNSNLLFISCESIGEIKRFANSFDLKSGSKVFFSKINDADVFSTFGSVVTPQIFIYNEKGNLIVEFKGAVNIETIISHIN